MKDSTKAMLFSGLGGSVVNGAAAGLLAWIGAGRGANAAIGALPEGVALAEAAETVKAGSQFGAALWAGIGTTAIAAGTHTLASYASLPEAPTQDQQPPQGGQGQGGQGNQ